jgi:hypothetical protein
VSGPGPRIDKEFVFKRMLEGDAAIQDMLSEDVQLHTGDHDVRWSCERYAVGIPYAEFWATAHPLIRMEVHVDLAAASGKLRALADCYRAESNSFDRVAAAHRYDFVAAGAFLPFQGIAVRVVPALANATPSQ